ncbi:aminotransferase class V-fold PLP-dependent enzyme [Methylocella sp.]|jgi:alanine-glyoxylate transaminase/serine-glyoxylate transaminase/serine-pyruvate transaminase|uniref:aminotransferase class V-fold PLP-dependent enzyme n=1 Tax=Methylocella sp. TaxID=1978226 RepID=UPI003C1C04D7
MAGRHFLFVPGPTNVPDRVLRAMLVPMEDHRSPKFPELTLPLFQDLKKIFKTTDGQIFLFPSSGTGAWESAFTNTLSPGDKVLASRFGQFTHLWIDMAQRLGFDVQVLEEEWGTGVKPEKIEEILRADKDHKIKAVTACHNETATGVSSDIGAVRKAIDAAGHPALLFVDTVSSLVSLDFRQDQWRVDLAISGSQKGLMLPAGLSVLSASPKAIAASKTAKSKRCYFDFDDMIKANATGYFPYTPPLPLLYGLREALKIINEEGLENIFERHHRLAGGVRAAVKAWGLQPCAKDPKWYSDTVTAIVVPPAFNAAEVISTAYRRYNLSLGAGLSQVAGKVFRIGHLGDLNELMLLGAIAGAEMAMADVGIPVQLGSGVAAAQAHYRAAPASAERAA